MAPPLSNSLKAEETFFLLLGQIQKHLKPMLMIYEN